MKKLMKIVFYVFLIAFILSPFLIRDYGLNPEEYALKLDIENGSFLEIGGYKTFYIDFNPNSEETILFLHGFGGSATNWLEVIPQLSDEGYRVVAVDLKGFGFSERNKNENYSHPAQVHFLNSFIEKLELRDITLVGHSMGANVATMYYQEYPEKIRNLVLVSPSLMEKRNEDKIRSNALKVLDFPMVREYARIILKCALRDGRVEGILNSAVYEPGSVNLQEPFFIDPTLFLGWEYVLIEMSASSFENVLKEDISEIDIPVLMIWGEEDTWVPVSKSNSLKRRIENSELEVFENVGHLSMLENPEGFRHSLTNFLKNKY